MRILVVDDSLAMRSFVSRTLKELGHTDVTLCESALDALSRIKREEWDLVLLDWHMPKMTGLEILQQTRTVMKKTTPIIMLTVEQVKENVQLAIRSGADDYIIKPLNKTLLSEKIARVREKHKAPPAEAQSDASPASGPAAPPTETGQ